MNIQSIGTTAQARQAYADKATSASSPPTNVNASNNGKSAVEENGPATPADSNKAVERNAATPSLEKVTQAVQNINKSLQAMSRDLEFSVDSDSNRTIVKVIDRKTQEIIRQIPSNEALEISKALDTAVQGLLMKQQA